MEYETRREPVQVQYVENETVTRKISRPVTRQKYVPYTETVMVQRQIVQRVPLNYYDPFAPAILNGYSSFGTPGIGSSIASPTPASPSPTVNSARPANESSSSETGPSVLSGPKNESSEAKTKLEKIETSTPSDAKEPASPGDAPPGDTTPGDDDELKAPVLESKPASYRIKFRPVFGREI